MNLEIVKSKYPKALSKLKEWSKEQLTATAGLPKEMADAIPDEMLLPSLVNSRALFDFFDLYNINIIINITTENKWYSDFNQGSSSTVYNTRKEAEDIGFEYGMKYLEKLLTNE